MPLTTNNACRRCGTCCRDGGPALHREDLKLLRQGIISHSDLITIRYGEPSYSPLVDRVEPSCFELVKLAGTGASWTCRLFSATDNRCSIYEDRPLECRLLNCREPEPLLRVIGSDTLQRLDLINPSDPVLQLIEEHKRRCSYGELNELIEKLEVNTADQLRLDRLSELLQEDITLRREAIEQWQLPLTMEMFIFGRPLFFSVQQYGLTVVEEEGRLQCKIMNAEL